jgi:RNA dependent RNA polymerase
LIRQLETTQTIKVLKWSCAKFRGKGCGLLRIEPEEYAKLFIESQSLQHRWRGQKFCVIFEKAKAQDDGKSLNRILIQNQLQEEIWLESARQHALYLENSQRISNGMTSLAVNSDENKGTFRVAYVQCGHYEYNNSHLEFCPIVPLGSGRIIFGASHCALLIDQPGAPGQWQYRIDITYWMVNMMVASKGTNSAQPSLYVSMRNAPKLFERAGSNAIIDQNPLFINQRELRALQILQRKRTRVSHTNEKHNEIAGTCFVYRLLMANNADLHSVERWIERHKDMPALGKLSLALSASTKDIRYEMNQLNSAIHESVRQGLLEFKVAFQVIKLAYNSKLLPWTVLDILPCIEREYAKFGVQKVVLGLREFYRSLSFMGAEASYSDFEKIALERSIIECIRAAVVRGSIFDTVRRHPHLMLIHRFRVTPTGIYLEGPEPEPSNRVLRRYASNIDNFARVVFSDEDGERLEYGLNTVLNTIYAEFLHRLRMGIEIFGQHYAFLGFSSSSLRSQTAWFMSPFHLNDTLVSAEEVIEGIGDFSEFDVPAKCAARIGQAFTETNSSVKIELSGELELKDIERNGRCFTDGCGTIVSDRFPEIMIY